MIRTVKDYEKLSEQYNKMIAERNSLIDDLSWYKAKVSRLEQRISKLVSENTKLQNDLFSEQLIQDESDDKIKKLERENEKFKESHIKHITNMENYYKDRVQELKEENKDKNRIISKRLEYENKENNQWHQMHKECADAVYNKKMMYESLLSEISQHIGNKPSSSTYKYFRAKLDGIGIKEGE